MSIYSDKFSLQASYATYNYGNSDHPSCFTPHIDAQRNFNTMELRHESIPNLKRKRSQSPVSENESQDEEDAEASGNKFHGKPKREKRTSYSSDQIIQLERKFKEVKYLSRTNRVIMAKSLSLNERQVKVWFQNRRMKLKKDVPLGTTSECTSVEQTQQHSGGTEMTLQLPVVEPVPHPCQMMQQNNDRPTNTMPLMKEMQTSSLNIPLSPIPQCRAKTVLTPLQQTNYMPPHIMPQLPNSMPIFPKPPQILPTLPQTMTHVSTTQPTSNVSFNMVGIPLKPEPNISAKPYMMHGHIPKNPTLGRGIRQSTPFKMPGPIQKILSTHHTRISQGTQTVQEGHSLRQHQVFDEFPDILKQAMIDYHNRDRNAPPKPLPTWLNEAKCNPKRPCPNVTIELLDDKHLYEIPNTALQITGRPWNPTFVNIHRPNLRYIPGA